MVWRHTCHRPSKFSWSRVSASTVFSPHGFGMENFLIRLDHMESWIGPAYISKSFNIKHTSYPTYFQTGVGHSQVWCRLAMEPDSLINLLSFQAFVQSAVVVVRPCPGGSRQVMTVIESLLGEACKPAQSQWVPGSHLRRIFKAREWPSPKCVSSNADRIVSQTITGAPFSTDTQE